MEGVLNQIIQAIRCSGSLSLVKLVQFEDDDQYEEKVYELQKNIDTEKYEEVSDGCIRKYMDTYQYHLPSPTKNRQNQKYEMEPESLLCLQLIVWHVHTISQKPKSVQSMEEKPKSYQTHALEHYVEC